MRLSKIRLAGFKSFVDPTSIHLPSSLVGIVGPNGCGKSNVIDAVRWVMGESSAKHLRGDSMADVIFNGSASRKPVGTATIELCFDNSDGSIGGQYAQYSEISIKRSISRDGTSLYFLNNTRCRRKDITDIFLGTGLGPRSYAIIEQGMVSRLVDAKPDEMRNYIEEAAGISKYKERRRETETRIQHTRDNLARLNDLREEIAKQIDYLHRQAKAAERYQEQKSKERRLEAELFAIRLSELERNLESQRLQLAKSQTGLEAAVAEQRSVEVEIVKAREGHVAATEGFNAVQARYYGVQSEASRLEQAIAHARELRERQQTELQQTQGQLAELSNDLRRDSAGLQELDSNLEQLAPDLQRARSAEVDSLAQLKRAEEALDQWQDAWHQFNLELKEYQQHGQVEQTRVEHLNAQLATLRRQQESLEKEQGGILLSELEGRLTEQESSERQIGARVTGLTGQLQQLDQELETLRQRERELGAELETQTADLASRRGQLGALEAVQRAALGSDSGPLSGWLERRKLTRRPRLVQRLQVEDGWVLAAETVLGDFLQAVCVEHPAEHLQDLPASRVFLVEDSDVDSPALAPDSLLGKVRHAGKAGALLAPVRTSDSLTEALKIHRQLRPGESVITRDGVWLGAGWVRINCGQKAAAGLLSREKDLRVLQQAVTGDEGHIAVLDQQRAQVRQRVVELDQARVQASMEFNAANREHAEAVAVLENLRQDFARSRDRRSLLDRDSTGLSGEIESLELAVREAQARGEDATAKAAERNDRLPVLQREQEELRSAYTEASERADAAREDLARFNIEFEGRRVSRESMASSLARVIAQREQLLGRGDGLRAEIAAAETPLAQMQAELSQRLQEQLAVEQELTRLREAVEVVEADLRAADGRRLGLEKGVSAARDAAEALRMQVREVEVRREGLLEQFAVTGAVLADVVAQLAPDAEAQLWQQNLEDIRRRIDRLGPINLAAIEQFNEQSERKKYLDAQFEDLTTALETLEQAIRRIDRETRSRFQETFDNVNQGLKRIFPRLFGGGHAYLTLEGDDILASGVTVMARPPGKRNSHIHLLSGGEKALTAVALIFSIFELNPAPFCLLDEVDAPLDDANVGRFCEIVREMSQRIQFLVITHNKTTMEMTSQLMGVTMQEPGVSRLVSVDLDEAVQLAVS